MPNLKATGLKTFIGSKNFDESRDFYVALGCTLHADHGDLAELEIGGSRFYLQNYYHRGWCNNSMLHLTVESADAWYEHVTQLLAKRSYGAARVKPPALQSYGATVTHVWGPVGILWHFAQPLS